MEYREAERKEETSMKIAVITGASSGMGRELAMKIGDQFGGIEELWLIARREDRLKELEGRTPAKVRCFAMDITVKEERDVLAQALRESKPDVKILVNAAGFGKIGRMEEMDGEVQEDMVRLNCQALCAMTRLVLPYMSPNSRIIQFASAAAFLPQPRFGVYAATKAFVLSYSRALGAELKKRKICVTAVCPGPVKTEFFSIAETWGEIPVYKRLVMADAGKVAGKALHDSCMGKSVSVYGLTMKAFFVLCKIIPHSWLLAAMAAMDRELS